jgi:hypothetical protein
VAASFGGGSAIDVASLFFPLGALCLPHAMPPSTTPSTAATTTQGATALFARRATMLIRRSACWFENA